MPGFLPIIPAVRREPFDDPAWLSDLKLDGFRGRRQDRRAHAVEGRQPHEAVQGVARWLAPGHVFDGEIVALGDAGRPVFNDLMFARRAPSYVAFDVLIAAGQDV